MKKTLAFSILLLTSAPALAHGDAQWIMDNPQTAWCCGPKDCWSLEELDIQIAPGIYRSPYDNKLFYWGEGNVHPSVDGHFWICVNHRSKETRCVFVPLPGV